MKAAVQKSVCLSPVIRHPVDEDGRNIWRLVKDTGILDLNSAYCYLLLCRHFRNTCRVAEINDEIAGFVTAYKVPADETTLFIWQVGIAENARKRGLAKKLVLELLDSNHCKNTNRVQATVSSSNTASLALFRSLARDLNTGLEQTEFFGPALFPAGHRHEKEMLITVGQF
jgi:L-2,4-diaminobutyric acid acetyltransferase